jgi:hypothetical protein
LPHAHGYEEDEACPQPDHKERHRYGNAREAACDGFADRRRSQRDQPWNELALQQAVR